PKETMSRESPGKRTVFRTSRTFSSFSSVVVAIASSLRRITALRCQLSAHSQAEPAPTCLADSGKLHRLRRLLSQSFDRVPHLAHHLVPLFHRSSCNLDRCSDHEDDSAGRHVPCASRKDLPGARDPDGQQRMTGLQGEQSGPFLERSELAGA